MIKRIILENFMSHAHTVLDLDDGVTVVLGPNNSGKSAIVVALQVLCYNESGDYMVRHGEKETRVTVELEGGHVVTWRRRNRVVCYEVDGKVFERLNRGVPDEVRQLLMLDKVEPEEGGDPFDIHFGMQKKPLFLLDESPRRAAVFFASSSGAANLIEMQKRHRQGTQERRRRQTMLQEELDGLLDQLEPLKVLDKQAHEVDLLEKSHAEILKEDESVARLGSDLLTLTRALDDASRLDEEASALSKLEGPPIPRDLRKLEREVCEIRDLLCEEVRRHKSLAALEALTGIPGQTDEFEFSAMLLELKRTLSNENSLRRTGGSLERLEVPPEGLATKVIAKDLGELAALEKSCEVMGREYERLAALRIPLDPPVFDGLERDLDELSTCIRVETTMESKASSIMMEVSEIRRRLEDYHRENPNCPTCGGLWETGRLLAFAKTRNEENSERHQSKERNQ